MKNLFITYNSNEKKKDEKKVIFKCCERKDEKIDFNDNYPSNSIQEIPLNNTINSSASTTTNSSIESRKISYSNNIFITEPQVFVEPIINNNISNNSNSYQFLGKKTKVHFDVIKNEETKEINKISIFNSNKKNMFNSQIIGNSDVNNYIDKNDSSELNQEKTLEEELNENNSILKIKNEKNWEKNSILNEGRWSDHEHIKFIEAIAKYGKNWKDVQKYVGSRSSAQARSHAQKFFLKLKAIKNSKLNFDFSSNDIKSISDIIRIIKNRKEYYIQGEDYIINTLINLSESINYDENIDYIKDSKMTYKNLKNCTNSEKNDDFLIKEESSVNFDKQLKLDIYNIFNKSKKIATNYKNKETNEESNNLKNKNIDNKGKDYNITQNIICTNLIEEEFNIEKKKKKIESSYNKSDDNFNKSNDFLSNRNNYIIDDGIVYMQEESDFFNMNNISLKIKEYYYMKNLDMQYSLYHKNFFS